MVTCAVLSESAAKMPPVWNQRTPCRPKMSSQLKSPGLSCDAAVLPRSGTPTAPRMPKPRSVKLRPLRTVRPMPSSSRHLMKSVATPPCMMKSSTRWPTSLSTKAVQTAVRRPKHLRRPRDVLYSPPPSQTLNSRATRTRVSPGSRRSMTSPSETWSNLHSEADLILRLMGARDSEGLPTKHTNHTKENDRGKTGSLLVCLVCFVGKGLGLLRDLQVA